MRQLKPDDIIMATGGTILSRTDDGFTGISIDSRSIRPGELFVALRGDRFDGHDFLPDALKNGAGALVEKPVAGMEMKTLILVEDTLRALQQLASYLRGTLESPVVGVTGTNGKTTTKELVAAVLGQRWKVLKTLGNLNNHIGVPLCISRMDGDEEAMVLEMGSNAEGDIRLICDISRPDFAVVTNVGPAHLEGFGTLEAVRKTDLEILSYVKTACLNADDLFLMEGVKGFEGRIITYGIENHADVVAREIMPGNRGSCFILCLPDGSETAIRLQLSGRFNILNALAAASAGYAMGISPEEIRLGLESFKGVAMRLEIEERSGILVIRDVYNANPASTEAALSELVRLAAGSGGRTIAVLGDMLELGPYSEAAHRQIVEKLNMLQIDILLAVGPEMSAAALGFEGACYWAGDSGKAGQLLSGICQKGDFVLVKGSRGMRMEYALECFGKMTDTEGSHAL